MECSHRIHGMVRYGHAHVTSVGFCSGMECSSDMVWNVHKRIHGMVWTCSRDKCGDDGKNCVVLVWNAHKGSMVLYGHAHVTSVGFCSGMECSSDMVWNAHKGFTECTVWLQGLHSRQGVSMLAIQTVAKIWEMMERIVLFRLPRAALRILFIFAVESAIWHLLSAWIW